MAIHVATFVEIHVDTITGAKFTKEGASLDKFETPQQRPTTRPREWTSEKRIFPDATNPNTASYPTLEAYLTSEAASGYKLAHLDQTYIITQT